MTNKLLTRLFLIGFISILIAKVELFGQVIGLHRYTPTILIKVDTSYLIADSIKLRNADFKWFRKRYYLMKPEKYKTIFDASNNETAVVLRLKRRYYDKLNPEKKIDLMEIDKLINDYKNQVKICSQLDYDDRKTIRANNKAVTRMYKIVELLNRDDLGLLKFKELLDIGEYETNLWAATHILEKMSPDMVTEKKALRIIKEVASGTDTNAMGYRAWLENYFKDK